MRRGRVTVQAILAVEFTVEVEVAPKDGESELELGRAAALRSEATKEWDLTSQAAARALLRGMWRRGRVRSLTVSRQTANLPGELLVRRGEETA